MGSKQQRNAKQISNSPKQSTKKIAFKNQYESADPLYKNLKIIKFQNLLRLNNCLFMCQLEQNKKLAATFPGLVYTKEKHNYNTRSARKNLLDTLFAKPSLMGCNLCLCLILLIGLKAATLLKKTL